MTVPLRIRVPDALEEVTKLGDVYDRLNYCVPRPEDSVYLDLQKVTFISPYGLLGLLFLGKKIYEMTGNKVYIIDSKDRLVQYLERMDFFGRGDQWFNKPAILERADYRLTRSMKTKSLLEIQKIGTIENRGKFHVDSIVAKFRQRATAILDSFQERMNVDFFVKVISELCTNVYTHSQSDGYVAIQRYQYEKRGFEVVKLAVMDDGIGIMNSLEKRYRFKYKYECEYIKKAFEPNISGVGDRGFGLYEVKSIVEKSIGYLWVNSGKAALLLEPNSQEFKEYVNLPFFSGTRIAIILAFKNISFPIDNADGYPIYF